MRKFIVKILGIIRNTLIDFYIKRFPEDAEEMKSLKEAENRLDNEFNKKTLSSKDIWG